MATNSSSSGSVATKLANVSSLTSPTFMSGTTMKLPLRRQEAMFPGDAFGKRRLISSASNSNAVDMENYQGTIYFADLKLDGKTYVVQMDTGSSDLWISCYYYDSADCKSSCPSGASTISYGSGNVCVEGTSLTLQFGNIEVANYVVGIAQGENVQPKSSNSLLAGDAQGLFGLAYDSLATLPSPDGQFVDYVKSFSMYLTQADSSDGSFLLLNGVDDALISANGLTGYTVALKSANPTHWTIGMTAFQVGDNSAVFPCSTASDGSCDSIVDSGTSLLAMPHSVYTSFVETYLTPNSCQEYSTGSGIYACPQDMNLPRLAFTFNNETFYLEKEDYIISLGGGWNIVEVQATASGNSAYANTWILGQTFLKVFYTSYNVDASVTFYCVEGETCTLGSKAVAVPPSSDSSGGGAYGGGKYGGSGNSGLDGTSSSSDDNNRHLVTILVIVLGVLGFFFIVAAVSWFFRCICNRRRRDAHERSLQPAMVIPGGYYRADPAVQPTRGPYA